MKLGKHKYSDIYDTCYQQLDINGICNNINHVNIDPEIDFQTAEGEQTIITIKFPKEIK